MIKSVKIEDFMSIFVLPLLIHSFQKRLAFPGSYKVQDGNVKTLGFDVMLAETKFNSFKNLLYQLNDADAYYIRSKYINSQQLLIKNVKSELAYSSNTSYVSPPYIHGLEIRQWSMNILEFTLFNGDFPNFDVFSDSSDLYFEITTTKSTKRIENPVLRAYLIPSKVGYFSSSIFVNSTGKIIQIPITYKVTPSILGNFQQNYFFRQNFDNFIKIRFQGQPIMSIVFDNAIFEYDFTTISQYNINLTIRKELRGKFITFINIYVLDEYIIVPLTISILESSVYPCEDSINLIFSHNDESSIGSISLFNGLNETINIIDASINPGSLELRVDLRKFSLPGGATDTVGFIIVYQAYWKEFCGNIIITANSRYHSFKCRIPLFITTRNGTLSLIPHQIEEISSGYLRQYSIKSFLSESIVISGFSPTSDIFCILEFEPLVMNASGTSPMFIIGLENPINVKEASSVSIIAHTNLGDFKISAEFIIQNVTIYPNKISFDNVIQDAVNYFNLTITNQNHFSLRINKLETIYAKVEVIGNSKIRSKSSSLVNFKIIFHTKVKSVDDQLKIYTNYGLIKLNLSACINQGKLNITTTLEEQLMFGNIYSGSIILQNELYNPIQIEQVNTNYKALKITNTPKSLNFHEIISLADFSLTFDSTAFPDFFALLDMRKSYIDNVRVWENMFTDGVRIQMIINLKIGNNFYSSAFIHKVKALTLPRVSSEIASALPNTPVVQSFVIKNFFDIPLLYEFEAEIQMSPTFAADFPKSLIIPPHGKERLNITFNSMSEGFFHYTINTRTNCTQPGAFNVDVTVKKPYVIFAPRAILFEGEIKHYFKWMECTKMMNQVNSTVKINQPRLSSTDHMSFWIEKTVLQPYKSYDICFNFYVYKYDTIILQNDLVFTFKIYDSTYLIPIRINIDRVSIAMIHNLINRTLQSVSIFVVLIILLLMLINSCKYLILYFKVRRKLKHQNKSKAYYSSNRLIDTETDIILEIPEPPTYWGYSPHEYVHNASVYSIEKMESYISNIDCF